MKKILVIALGLYLLTSAASFAVFSNFRKTGRLGMSSPVDTSKPAEALPTPDPEARIMVPAEAPRSEVCPINGKMYSTLEKDSWDVRRPLFVMVENSLDSRPQSGLGSADLVYETVVEGGITRFMAMYYCEAQHKEVTVAPVRSARQVFLDWASEYNFPLYAHVGGANGADTDPRVRALEHINDYGWNLRNDLNQFSIGYPTFVRNYDRIPDKEVDTEHTMESTTELLWKVADKRKITNMLLDTKIRGKVVPGLDWRETFVPWTFQDDAVESARGTVASISHEFWSGYTDFALKWEYDRATNSYKRNMGGEPHVDLNTDKPIMSKNVVVMQVKEYASVDIHKHNYIMTAGTGKALIFQNGNAIQGTWTKKDRLGRTVFKDEKGKEVQFVRGLIWMAAVPTGTVVTY